MISRTEPFTRWFALSVILHAALFGAVIFGGVLFPSKSSPWGVSDGGMTGIHVKVVDGPPTPGIMLPPQEQVNPGAPPSDSPGWQPEPETSAKSKTPKPKIDAKPTKDAKPPVSKNAIAIPDPGSKAKPSVEPVNQTASAVSPTPAPPNAVLAGSGGTASIAYGARTSGTGTTSVGFSEGAFGERFGWYASQLTAAVSKYWSPAPGATAAPRVSVLFTINKDGSVSNVEIETKSNNDALDNSARRAIMQAAANKLIPPLPNEFRGSRISARLTFEYSVR